MPCALSTSDTMMEWLGLPLSLSVLCWLQRFSHPSTVMVGNILAKFCSPLSPAMKRGKQMVTVLPGRSLSSTFREAWRGRVPSQTSSPLHGIIPTLSYLISSSMISSDIPSLLFHHAIYFFIESLGKEVN